MSLFKIETNGSGMQHIWIGNSKVRLDGQMGKDLLEKLQSIETAAKLLNYKIKQELHLKISFKSVEVRRSFELSVDKTKTGRLRNIMIQNHKNETYKGRMLKDIDKVFGVLDRLVEEL